jgi:hypothetical protein
LKDEFTVTELESMQGRVSTGDELFFLEDQLFPRIVFPLHFRQVLDQETAPLTLGKRIADRKRGTENRVGFGLRDARCLGSIVLAKGCFV